MPEPAGPQEVRELEAATRAFLAQHRDALQDPARAREACASLLDAFAEALPRALDAARAALPTRTDLPRPGESLPPDVWAPAEREAFACASLRKRLAEAEGALLHLRLALARAAPQEVPPEAAWRTARERRAALDALTGLDAALRLWADAADALASGHSAPAASDGAPGPLLRLARQCLHHGAADAAAALLRRALAAGLSAPLSPPPPGGFDAALGRWAAAGTAPRGVDLARCRDADARLAALQRDDALAAWALLDFVERVANAAATTPAP